jgi:ubiquinone/menaquinone biosynthesis C-methylase UbiE
MVSVMDNGRIKNGYKSVANLYDNYITGKNLFFKIIAKTVWGFTDKEYSQKLLEYIPNDFSGKLLDIPAGTGVLTIDKYSKINAAKIVCMDYSIDMLKIAKQRFDKNNLGNIECIQRDAGNIPFADEIFDTVISMNGFHAFPDKRKAFVEINRVLKNNGTLIGCFYIKGMVKRTDWFINKLFVKNGTFTPPFFDFNEVKEKLNENYEEIELWNMGSIICFKCRKNNGVRANGT